LPRVAWISLRLPKVAQDLLDAFGSAVNLARIKRGWELKDIAYRIAQMDAGASGKKVNPPAISFLSNIQNGKRSISTTTVGKLIHALDLPETWLTRFMTAAPDEVDEVTTKDREVDRLLRLTEQDETAPETREVLLLRLAKDWSGKGFADPMTAYTALRGALQAAADLKAKTAQSSNSSDHLKAILRRVSELNDDDRMDEADAVLQAAFERDIAEAESFFEANLKQDRLRDRPTITAHRLISRISESTKFSEILTEVHKSARERLEKGKREGDLFDLNVALELAKYCVANSMHGMRPRALETLALCHVALGERYSSSTHFASALASLEEAIGLLDVKENPGDWAAAQNSLGKLLEISGKQKPTSTDLQAAIDAHQKALGVLDEALHSKEWALTHRLLGNAYSSIGKKLGDIEFLKLAEISYEKSISAHKKSRDVSEWAISKNNQGNAFRAYGSLTSDVMLLEKAVKNYRAALLARRLLARKMDYFRTAVNLGSTYADLGKLTNFEIYFYKADSTFKLSISQYCLVNAPLLWANTQYNIARLCVDRDKLGKRRMNVAAASHHLALARQVFAERGNDHQLAQCDRLLEEINLA
jgi:tetratricopeptide (TPR) repeat protein